MSQLQLPSHLFGKRRSLFNWWSLWAGLRPLTGYQPYFCRSTCYETTLPSGRASSCSSSHRSNSSSRHRSSRRSSRRSSLPVWPVSCAYLLSCPPFSNSSLVQQRPPTPAAFTSSTCSSRHSGCSCVRRPSSFGGGAPPSPFGRWVGGGVKRLRCILGNFSGALCCILVVCHAHGPQGARVPAHPGYAILCPGRRWGGQSVLAVPLLVHVGVLPLLGPHLVILGYAAPP